MSWRKRAVVVESSPEPSPPKHYTVRPEFIIEGPEVTTDDEGTVTLDVSGLPPHITSLRLVIGRLSCTHPFDIDGERVRHPDLQWVRFYAPRP